jgi:endo-1,4-beta-xylanase
MATTASSDLAAYPNPAQEQVTFSLTLAAPALVRLVVYDVLGREVALLADGEKQAGHHETTLDGSTLPAGTYVVRLEAGGTVETRRLTLVR